MEESDREFLERVLQVHRDGQVSLEWANWVHIRKAAKGDDLDRLLRLARNGEAAEGLVEELKRRHTSKCNWNNWESSGGGYRYNPNAGCICDNIALAKYTEATKDIP